MNKETFIVFSEWEDNCEDLTDEEFGRLMRAFFKYAKNGVKPTFSDRAMRACWRPIQQATDRANEAYQAKCEKNRENGKKGGAPKGNMNAQKQPNNPNNQTVEKTTENNRKQPKQPFLIVIVIVILNVIVVVNVNVNLRQLLLPSPLRLRRTPPPRRGRRSRKTSSTHGTGRTAPQN